VPDDSVKQPDAAIDESSGFWVDQGHKALLEQAQCNLAADERLHPMGPSPSTIPPPLPPNPPLIWPPPGNS
jgi:hypothetical protein